jgi:RNA polymerase sigma-70 factor (ECF subfamily)
MQFPPFLGSIMTEPGSTCWTIIKAAAAGGLAEREEFARRYGPAIRAYLAARWRDSSRLGDLDDAVQEVFLECLKQGGVLDRAERGRPGGFRAFLYGAARNVARRLETRRLRAREQQPPADGGLDGVEADEDTLSRVFDRAWARALLREAARRHEERAATQDEAARRRVELLRLRFHEGLRIREIAQRWGADPTMLHHEYARVRREFRAALLDTIAFHHPGTPAELEQECANLLTLLG